jgi:hypothetical protein
MALFGLRKTSNAPVDADIGCPWIKKILADGHTSHVTTWGHALAIAIWIPATFGRNLQCQPVSGHFSGNLHCQKILSTFTS